MELAVTASGGTLGGVAGYGGVAAYGGLERGALTVMKYPMAIGLAMLGGGRGAECALSGTDAAIAASREIQAARTLPAIAIGALVGGLIAYGGYRWITDDSKAHKV